MAQSGSRSDGVNLVHSTLYYTCHSACPVQHSLDLSTIPASVLRLNQGAQPCQLIERL